MAAAVVQVSSCSPSQRRAVTSKGLPHSKAGRAPKPGTITANRRRRPCTCSVRSRHGVRRGSKTLVMWSAGGYSSSELGAAPPARRRASRAHQQGLRPAVPGQHGNQPRMGHAVQRSGTGRKSRHPGRGTADVAGHTRRADGGGSETRKGANGSLSCWGESNQRRATDLRRAANRPAAPRPSRAKDPGSGTPGGGGGVVPYTPATESNLKESMFASLPRAATSQ